MSNFMFNFSVPEDGNESHSEDNNTEQEPDNQIKHGPSISVPRCDKKAVEIPVLPFHDTILEYVKPSHFSVPGSSLKLSYISASNIKEAQANLSEIQKSSSEQYGMELNLLLELSDSQHTDLISGVYEGGMKVWECSIDLVQYLLESKHQFMGMRVLELGCGAGLPAIVSLMKGAKIVDFQDYNPEVINYVTIPSVLENINHTTPESNSHITCPNSVPMISKCKFYSGDWTDFTSLSLTFGPPNFYDIILTSETIYSESSQPKLLKTLKALLDPQKGVVLVAAKSYYFGVGGGVAQFEHLVREDGYFDVKTCHTVLECSVPRVILALSPKAMSQQCV